MTRRSRPHRDPARPAPTSPNRGPMHRAKRMALDLDVYELGLPLDVAGRLPWVEDGTEDPACGWPALHSALYQALGMYVRGHVAMGGDWRALRLNPWSYAEIRDAAAAMESAA